MSFTSWSRDARNSCAYVKTFRAFAVCFPYDNCCYTLHHKTELVSKFRTKDLLSIRCWLWCNSAQSISTNFPYFNISHLLCQSQTRWTRRAGRKLFPSDFHEKFSRLWCRSKIFKIVFPVSHLHPSLSTCSLFEKHFTFPAHILFRFFLHVPSRARSAVWLWKTP